MAKEINVEQKSDQWHALRRGAIGSSEVSAILGTNPWATALTLWEVKTGRREPQFMNSAMQRGVDYEDTARAELEKQTGFQFTPKVFQDEEHSFLMASLDGITEDGKVICEIKCPTSDGLRIYCLRGKIPPYYETQIEYQMLVSGAERAIFFVWYSPGDHYIVEFSRNETRLNEVKEAVIFFWNEYIVKDIAPPSTKADYEELEDAEFKELADQYLNLYSLAKDTEEKLKELKEKIKRRLSSSPKSGIKGFGISALELSVKGQVNYAAIPELQGVDLEKYRKKATKQIRITVQG